MNSRQQSLLNVPPQLFPSHNNHQLRGQLYQTTTRITLGQGESLFTQCETFHCSQPDLKKACEERVHKESQN